MARKPLITPSAELEHPAAGGSYRRLADGSLQLVATTAPHAPDEPEQPPAPDGPTPPAGEA